MKTLLKYLIPSLALILILATLSFSDSNGVWHRAEDIRGGTFGSDEQPTSDYQFIDPVDFDADITVTTISSSNANGNVVIQLG